MTKSFTTYITCICTLVISLINVMYVVKDLVIILTYTNTVEYTLVIRLINVVPVGDLLLFKVDPSPHLKKFSVPFVLH
jgi:hypothetical protein